MTNQEKIKIFEGAIEAIRSGISDGLCRAIHFASEKNKLEDFPELMRYKPEKPHSNYWFDPYNKETRIMILQTEINKLKAMDENLKSKLIELTKKGEDLTSWVKKEFPEAFEEDKSVDLNGVTLEGKNIWTSNGELLGYIGFNLAPEKKLRDRCLMFTKNWIDWEIREDEHNVVLIPTRK